MTPHTQPRTFIRARVRLPGGTACLPLDAALASMHAPTGRGRLIAITGGPGSGKSTALAQAAAQPQLAGLRVLDEPTPTALTLALNEGPVLAATSPQLAALSPSIILELLPWGDDEVIEYCLANYRPLCSKLIPRALAVHNRQSFEGRPALWAPALDLMAQHEALGSADEIFDAVITATASSRTITAAAKAVFLSTRDDAAQRLSLVPEPLRLLIRYTGPREHLQSSYLIRELERSRAKVVLAQVPSASVLASCAHKVCSIDKARRCLVRIAEGRPDSLQSAAVTLLHAADDSWRPLGKRPLCLEGAILDGAQWERIRLVKLRAHDSSWRCANLRRSDLTHSHLARADLSSADLTLANLSHAKLQHTCLHAADLSRATCTGADFSSARLHDAILEEIGASDTQFFYTDLTGARLVRAHLVAAQFYGSPVCDADFTASDMREARLMSMKLNEATFTGASFNSARLQDCDMSAMHLPAASFAQAELHTVDLTATSMPSADFTGARLTACGLADIDWEGASLRNATMIRCTFHMGSSRSGLVGSTIAGEGSRTGFYTDEYTAQTHKAPEEIRKANLCRADLRGVDVTKTDFYLVDLRQARYDTKQAEWLKKCGAILFNKEA